MNMAAIAALVLLALLVGAALPVLAQARASLRAWQRTGEEAREVVGRVRRELAALDGGGARVAEALGAVDELGRAAVELRRTVNVASAVGAALGPAVAAAVRTMREPRHEEPRKENHHEAA
jgi:hypothetical protein